MKSSRSMTLSAYFVKFCRTTLIGILTLRLLLLGSYSIPATSIQERSKTIGRELEYVAQHHQWSLISQDQFVSDICTGPNRRIVAFGDGNDQHNRTNGEETSWTIMMTVNDGYYDFFLNWYKHYQKLNLTLDIVLFAEDQVAFEKLKEAKLPRTKIVQTYLELLVGRGEGVSFHYSSWQYVALVSRRPGRMLDLLCTGRNVLYVDADTVWQSNPLEYLLQDTKSDGHTKEDPTTSSATPDAYMIVDKAVDLRFAHETYFCTGFIAVRANRKSLNLMSKWEEQLKKLRDANQPIFNAVYSDLYRYRTENKIDIPYVHPLSTKAFPRGQDFFWNFNQTEKSNAVQVHANFITGHENKKQRLKEEGLWLLD